MRLVGERAHDLRPGRPGEQLQELELERGEVVEAVYEDGGTAPPRRLGPQRVERPLGKKRLVDEPRGVERVPVGRVQRAHLLGHGAARAVARPGAERLPQARRVDHGAAQLGEEAARGAGEARAAGGLGERVEGCGVNRVLDEEVALSAAGMALAAHSDPAALRRDLEQPGEPNHPGAEDRAPRGELALGVTHVAQGRNHQHRFVRDPLPVRAEHAPCLPGVGGSRDERERHGPECTGAADAATALPRNERGPSGTNLRCASE